MMSVVKLKFYVVISAGYLDEYRLREGKMAPLAGGTTTPGTQREPAVPREAHRARPGEGGGSVDLRDETVNPERRRRRSPEKREQRR